MSNKLARLAFTAIALLFSQFLVAETPLHEEYAKARWAPIHFAPLINEAKDEQCLQCHQNILDDEPRGSSPAGLGMEETLAWYQMLGTYQGEQDTFHRRHLQSEYASQVMDFKCNTCHQGNDPREEVAGSSTTTQLDLTMRKQVDPYVCVMCHGQNNFQKMGLPQPWPESSSIFGESCLTCHVAIKTERHQGIEFLNVDKIEELAAADSDVCYGCHGGRAWYATWFPYSEKKWPGHGQAPLGARHKYPVPEVASADSQAKTIK